jgi:uncharacterized protein YcbK (DUF882 family)
MGDLSEHFDSSEFRCPCGECPDSPQINPVLVTVLEALRAELGGAQVTITSGVRCAARNAKDGGAPHSQHLLGNAADFHIEGVPEQHVSNAAWAMPEVHGVGLPDSGTFVHVDVRTGPKVHWRYDLEGKEYDTEYAV